MKKQISLLFIFSLFFTPTFVLVSHKCFSQQNCYNPQNDTTVSTGEYYDVQTESTKNIKFLKHFVNVKLTESNLNDTSFLSKLYLFLQSYNGEIVNNEIRAGGFLDIRLCDSMNAINYFQIFRNSNLFESVTPILLIKEDSCPIDPTDLQLNMSFNGILDKHM